MRTKKNALAYAIKLENGKYYAGYGKLNSSLLSRAQFYRTENEARSIAARSSHFHRLCSLPYRIIQVKIAECNEAKGTS